MIKICITLDDVIRAKTKQIGFVFKKYKDVDIDLDKLDLTNDKLDEVFKFGSKKEYNKFLYEDYPFEIFAEASTVEPGIDKKLNLWHISLNDDENIDDELDLILANPMEFNASIGYSHFFLSKIATRVREVHFPMDSLSIWDKCDILITATPKLLKNIPNGKVAVKIKTDYNSNINGENIFEYESLNEFISNNENLRSVVDFFNKK